MVRLRLNTNLSIDKNVIKARMTEAKVFAVLFREDNTDKLFLWVALSYSLEDVYEALRMQMPKHEQWLPYMWQSVSIRDLVVGASQVGEQMQSPKKDNKETVPGVPSIPDLKAFKNELMKKIIDTKDIKLFEANEMMFTASEKKYIKEMMKKNG